MRIADEDSQQIVGTLDVESDKQSAFTDADQRHLEEYARAMVPLWK